jgi:hypothetical protein
MAVVVEVVIPEISRDQYDALRTEVGWLEEPPAGGISHTVWWEGDDCHGLDVWEDDAAWAEFGQTRMGPAMAKLGIDAEVQTIFHQPHEVFVPKAVTITAS